MTISQKDVDHFRAKNILPEGGRLTRYNSSNVIKIGDATFDFDYRRDSFDFKLEKQKLKYIGIPKLLDDTNFNVFLTNSGQAAINAAYFYVDKVLNLNKIESHNDYLYVGAYRLQSIYQIYHSKKSSECLWICSTATQFEQSLSQDGYWKLVVVDTTCWAVGSAEIQRIYDKYINCCDLLVLFRSHSKLDMGGVEYGSLGNLSLFSKDQALIDEASEKFKRILGLSGSFAILDEIPPYLFSESFYESSKRRVQAIVDNTLFIKDELESTSLSTYGELLFPDHYKYFFLRLKKDTPAKTIEKLIQKLNFTLGIHLKDVKSCASFGFNFPSVTFYASDENIGHFFRFCPGVIDSEELKNLVLCIKEVFSR
ncbi:MAG: hypothetical protein KC478_11995 [Bacteriovoracaceae bacterium]|nr:hypothetical protein [Bacteriovoracaceae bacterium]